MKCICCYDACRFMTPIMRGRHDIILSCATTRKDFITWILSHGFYHMHGVLVIHMREGTITGYNQVGNMKRHLYNITTYSLYDITENMRFVSFCTYMFVFMRMHKHMLHMCTCVPTTPPPHHCATPTPTPTPTITTTKPVHSQFTHLRPASPVQAHCSAR